MENLLKRLREAIADKQEPIPPGAFSAHDFAAQQGCTYEHACKILAGCERAGLVERFRLKRLRANRLYSVTYYKEKIADANDQGNVARRNRSNRKSAR